MLLIFATQLLSHGKGTLAGVITDKQTGDPIVGANVFLPKSNLGAAADMAGRYLIVNVSDSLRVTVKCHIIGYKAESINNVKITAGDTTIVNIEMEVQVLQGEPRRLCNSDLLSHRTWFARTMFEHLSDYSVGELIGYHTGSLDDHALGGHSGEGNFLIDGLGGFDPFGYPIGADLPISAINSWSVVEGGLDAQYGLAQSEVHNMYQSSKKFVRYTGAGMGLDGQEFSSGGSDIPGDKFRHSLSQLDFSWKGTHKKIRTGYAVAGEVRRDGGRWKNDDTNSEKIYTSIKMWPSSKHGVRIVGFGSHVYRGKHDRRYAGLSYETEDRDGDGVLDRAYALSNPDPNDKRIIIHDYDGDGDRIHEDLNWNGTLDEIDFNRDGDYDDQRDMLSALATRNSWDGLLSVRWFWRISARQYFEVSAQTRQTRSLLNSNESLEEDRNGNGLLDAGEDYNGNNELDPAGWDLLTDRDNDGFIDASQYSNWNPDKKLSEWGDRSGENWKAWSDIQLGDNAGTMDGYKLYGDGYNFDPTRWAYESRNAYSASAKFTRSNRKYDITILGVEAHLVDAFFHGVAFPEGGGGYLFEPRYGNQKGQGDSTSTTVRPQLTSVFLQHQVNRSVLRKFRLDMTAGLRAERYDTDLDQTLETQYYYPLATPFMQKDYSPQVVLSPRIKLKIRWSDCVRFYADYGKYYHSPKDVLELTEMYEVGIKFGYKNTVSELKYFNRVSPNTTTFTSDYESGMFHAFPLEILRSTASGVKFRFVKPYGHNANFIFNYTYGKSEFVTEENFGSGYCSNCPPDSNEYTYFQPWDQRHSISAVLNLDYHKHRMGAILLAKYGSGYPYVASMYSVYEERLPSTSNMDLYLYKDFDLRRKFKGRPIRFNRARIFVEVKNVFDRRNIVQLYDAGWYHHYTEIQDQYENGNIEFFGGEDDLQNGIDDDDDGYIDETIHDEYWVRMDGDGDGVLDEAKTHPAGGWIGHPQAYGEPRVWRLGITYLF